MDRAKDKVHEALNNLPVPYRTAVNEFIIKLELAPSLTEADNIYQEFSSRFTIIPEISHWYELYSRYLGGHQPLVEWVRRCNHYYSQFSHLFNYQWKAADYWQCRYLNKLIENTLSPRLGPFSKAEYKVGILKKFQDLASLPLNRYVSYYWKIRAFASVLASPLPKTLLEKCEASYNESKKILAVKEDDEKWLALLKQTGDVECIIQNVECRIGKKPWNKKIWELYWQFLREQDLKDLLLNSYSRYCRLFTEDNDVFETYKAEVERELKSSKNVVKWKLDIMKFENDHCIITQKPSSKHMKDNLAAAWCKLENLESGMMLIEEYLRVPALSHDEFASLWLNMNDIAFGIGVFHYYFDDGNIDLIESGYFENADDAYTSLSVNPLMTYITNKDDWFNTKIESSPVVLSLKRPALKQTFSIPGSFTFYILTNTSDYLLQKLYFTCKWFFETKKLPICFKLDIGHSWGFQRYYENTLFIPPDSFITSTNFPSFHFTRVLSLQHIPNDLLSDVICKISKLNLFITELHLKDQNLTIEELTVFTEDVSTLIMDFTSDIRNGEGFLSAPEIVDALPKIKHFVFNNSSLFKEDYEPKSKKSLETFYTILDGRHLTLGRIASFCKFIEKHAAPSSHFTVDIHKLTCMSFGELDEEKPRILLTAISNLFEAMEIEEKPRLTLTLNRKDYFFS